MAKYYSKNELIQALQQLEKKLGRTPQPEDLSEPSAQNVLGYFKKWSKALKSAGITSRPSKKTTTPPVTEPVAAKTVKAQEVEEAVENSACSNRRYSKTMIKEMLLNEFNRLGKKPTRKEIDENKELPTVSTILKYFETTKIGDVWKDVLGE